MVSINKDAQPDKRSYKVSFDKFEKMAAGHTPVYDLEQSIKDLVTGLKSLISMIRITGNRRLIRLFVVNELLTQKYN